MTAITARPDRMNDANEERLHELRAALFGVEASALAIARHRATLDQEQLGALAQGLASEIRRIRALVEHHDERARTFDLASAITPAITCARAAGVRIESKVGSDVSVFGRSDHAAQVVTGVLDNARRHANGSPVDVWATIKHAWVLLHVGDRGPGPRQWNDADPFERGARGQGSTGSGLGLHVARRLMSDAGGMIWLRPRRGGGTTTVMAFPTGGTTCDAEF